MLSQNRAELLHQSVCHIIHFTRADQRTAQFDITELHHQAGTDTQTVRDLPGNSRLHIKCFQGDILYQMSTFPILSPVHGTTVGSRYAHTCCQIIIDFKTGIYIKRSAGRIIRTLHIISVCKFTF